MSLSEFHQYYLQSMGIELYASRARETTADIADKTITKAAVKVENTQQDAPSVQRLFKTTLLEDDMIQDICLTLSLDPSLIESLSDGHFKFVSGEDAAIDASFEWRFESLERTVELSDERLVSGPLSSLRQKHHKKALWQCLCQMAS